MGHGTARVGHLACTEKIRWIRIPHAPHYQVVMIVYLEFPDKNFIVFIINFIIMEYLIYFYFAMLAIFYTYVGYIWVKCGILPSISDSWYHLPEKQKPLFTLFCWGFALPAAIIGFTISEGNPFQFLMLFAAGGIMFVGAAPDFKKEGGMDRKVHYIAALTGVIANTFYLFLVFPMYWFFPASFVIGSLIIYALRHKLDEIWWIEILSFTSYAIVSGIVINKLLMLL